ncbi:MAG: glycoside hydrolase family 130 protein [Planctomycetota bacterium]|nr:glycoside hydrolase family 130 protein [Planctomycetota bacterium]
MLRRSHENPVLTRADVPASTGLVDPSSVFNPGAVELGGRVHLMLRVQARSRATSLVMASSLDGRRFEVAPKVVELEGLEREARSLHHVYDARLTRVRADDGGEAVVVIFAADMDDACRLGVARSRDLERFEFLGFSETPSRNGVLFPEKVGGRWLRLERPNLVVDGAGVATGDAVRLAWSDDLVTWELDDTPLFEGRWRYWDELIGPGPPPIRTTRGWLCLYHGVATHFASANIYQAGAVLLDGADPSRVIGRTWDNLLEPRELYEQVGQVPNVVFPSGAVVRGLEPGATACDDDELLVYYGAADTCVGLAMAKVGQLVEACLADR